jgi:hypothetical protein
MTATTKKKEATEKKAPIARKRFADKAESITIAIAGNKLAASVKEFAPGKDKETGKALNPSFGWHAGGKVVIEVDGVPLNCQANVILTVIDSKMAD